MSVAGEVLKASYSKPYIMHGAIGPACGIALYDNDILHIWTHSQGIYPFREGLQTMLGLEADKIHITGIPGAGCFGHNSADDAATDAALLAMAYPGRHVRVQWSRHDEHGWEPYGTAMLMELQATLDNDGKIISWQSDVWTDSHSNRPNKDAGTLLTANYLEKPFQMQSLGYRGGGHRNADPYYPIP
jgi:CO/xanthine dehydrogenase Mo-binding subunit